MKEKIRLKDVKYLKMIVCLSCLWIMGSCDDDGIPFEIKRQHNIPNTETKAALAEYNSMREDPASYKRYQSFDDLMKEVLDDA